MSNTINSHFSNEADARAAVSQLQSIGIPQSDISVESDGPQSGQGPSRDMTGAEMPRLSDTSDGLGQGGARVLVRVEDDRRADVEAILRRFVEEDGAARDAGTYDDIPMDESADDETITILRLYDARERARTAARGLLESGFPSEAVMVIVSRDTQASEPPASMREEFTRMGVHADDAPHYADRLHRGGSLVRADVPQHRADDAARILDEHGPLHSAEARKPSDYPNDREAMQRASRGRDDDAHEGKSTSDDAAPLSHALNAPTLSDDPAPLSHFLHIPVLTDD